MSNNAFVTDLGDEQGWWSHIVGHGERWGIDLDVFDVICPAPLGSPHGALSPLTRRSGAAGARWGPDFPQITPFDQARLALRLLDQLGVGQLHAIVGGSMGGMTALAAALLAPRRWDRLVGIATTGQTSPASVALRAVQRDAVLLDPDYQGGWYYTDGQDGQDGEGGGSEGGGNGSAVADADAGATVGPRRGMAVARKFGTIGYRSRAEFDERFDWSARAGAGDQLQGADQGQGQEGQGQGQGQSQGPDEAHSAGAQMLHSKFEVEEYLKHQARKFAYDANCYLLLSRAMDLMDLRHAAPAAGAGAGSGAGAGAGAGSGGGASAKGVPLPERVRERERERDTRLRATLARIPTGRQVMLLSFETDSLMPPAESMQLAATLGALGKARVHAEVLPSKFGHDTFLIPTQGRPLRQRLAAFLALHAEGEGARHDSVDRVRAVARGFSSD
eukprot:g3757.t1